MVVVVVVMKKNVRVVFGVWCLVVMWVVTLMLVVCMSCNDEIEIEFEIEFVFVFLSLRQE